MSPGNVRYLLEHEKDIPREKIGLCPNAIKIHDETLSNHEKAALRCQYGLPVDQTILLYGGNVGKPPGVDYILRCLRQLNNGATITLRGTISDEALATLTYIGNGKFLGIPVPVYLVLVMARCTAGYEMLPLVQDKALLDNILYSGVWTNLGRRGQKRGKKDD